jgi:hypothetical protein
MRNSPKVGTANIRARISRSGEVETPVMRGQGQAFLWRACRTDQLKQLVMVHGFKHQRSLRYPLFCCPDSCRSTVR